jgi:hypothetical protein
MLVICWLACAAGTLGADAKKEAKKSSARLPMYYTQVVDKEQRAQILAVLEEYKAKLDAVKAQMDALTKERDRKVDAVLTPEQLQKIQDLKAAARDKRAKGKDVKPAKGPKAGAKAAEAPKSDTTPTETPAEPPAKPSSGQTKKAK